MALSFKRQQNKVYGVSLSKWNPLLSYQPPAPHGEKSPKLMFALENPTANLDLLDMEASVWPCANPYDVNPIKGDTPKLEMEEFADLQPFLHRDGSPKDMTDVTDELNTPIFDRKGPFDFMVSENTYASTEPFEYVVQIHSKQQPSNSDLVNNTQQGSEANLLFATSESDHGNIFMETPQHQISATVFKTESVLSDSNISSPDYDQLGIETPEDSNSSSSDRNKVPKLKLDLNFNPNIVLNTPDVIDSVICLEKNFNLLDYLNEKDVQTVNLEDIQVGVPSTSQPFKTEPDAKPARKRSKPKRYDADDDDEDYVPPIKQDRLSLVSSDSESEEEEVPKTKRGRPPRRASSISSDFSDASKYRELRDKNNEASRKSRLKRKMKEMTLQKEADELNEKNVKLKAQVQEYERMVNNFRNNLFKIMLKK